MQAGLVYGQIGQTEYIVKNMIKESGLKDVKVVATGGLAQVVIPLCHHEIIYDDDLLLKGLMLIWNKNVK